MMQREPRPQPVVVVRQPVGFQSYCGYEQYSQPYRYPPQFYRPYGR